VSSCRVTTVRKAETALTIFGPLSQEANCLRIRANIALAFSRIFASRFSDPKQPSQSGSQCGEPGKSWGFAMGLVSFRCRRHDLSLYRSWRCRLPACKLAAAVACRLPQAGAFGTCGFSLIGDGNMIHRPRLIAYVEIPAIFAHVLPWAR